jgi:hypothetical protein
MATLVGASQQELLKDIEDEGKKVTTPTFVRLMGTPAVDLKACIPQIKKAGIDLPDNVTLLIEPEALIDAQCEDIFTLETFQNLILHSYRNSKAFLLARVMTIDTNFEGQTSAKCYWSDYAAHHINKVLYRTQLEQNLLHRMRCRNPLNNMPIVGRVHYYAIMPNIVSQAHQDYERRSGLKLVLDTRPLPWELSQGNAQGNVSQVSMTLSDGSQQKSELKVFKMKHRKSLSETMLNIGDDKLLQLTAVLKEPQPELQPNMESYAREEEEIITYEAKYVGSDEDYMTSAEFRDIFSKQAVNPEDAQLFPLFSDNNFALPTFQSNGEATNDSGNATAAPRPRYTQTRRWKNLGGLLWIPPVNSVVCKGTGILDPFFFLFLTLLYVGGVVSLCIFIIPDIWAYVAGFCCALLWVVITLLFMAWPY